MLFFRLFMQPDWYICIYVIRLVLYTSFRNEYTNATEARIARGHGGLMTSEKVRASLYHGTEGLSLKRNPSYRETSSPAAHVCMVNPTLKKTP